jgi:uncharacterized repeat protein (TIGR03806 family)
MRAALIPLIAALAAAPLVPAAAVDTKQNPRAAYGIDKRIPWTTSNVKGSPDPPAPYRTEVAFPKLRFSEPLEAIRCPGAARIFVAERYGKVFAFDDDPAVEKADLFFDIKRTVYGLALHPKFQENGFVYIVYVLDPKVEEPKGTRLSRFTATADRRSVDPDSEKILLEWPSGGHNGGCIRFGPDGYLYIVCSDGSGIADGLVTGQDVTDLLASILRIDVDHEDEGLTYAIPKDNPFLKTPGARPEIWAYGVRQPWKMSFDPVTGNLWAGEVGQDLWEMVYILRRGGNYGWSVQEGTHPFRPERKRGPTPIVPPIVEHPHSDFRSITGGYVYRGDRLPELAGAYIYGDYDTGRVWSLRYDGKNVSEHSELVDTPLRIICFCESQNSELYLVDFIGGQFHRLVPAPKTQQAHKFPTNLSQTGLFASVKDHQPAPGLIPYSVNSQLWSDGAYKERFLALPGTSQIEFETVVYPQPAPGSVPGWRFPDGTVIVKTFSLEMEKGNPKSRRRIETRLLHFEQLYGTEEIGDQYWKGYTYVWNDQQTEAELVEAKGLDRKYTIRDPANGKTIGQTWHFPSRHECTLCHTMPAKFVLGVNTHQFNRDHDYGDRIANQIATLEHLGIFKEPPPKSPEELPKIVDHEDKSVSLDARARAYLHSNCSHCHRKWGGGNAEFQLLATLPLEELGIVNTPAGQGTFEIPGAKILTPGHPETSLLYTRMKRRGLGQMPHVATNLVDEEGVKLIEEWIKSLK